MHRKTMEIAVGLFMLAGVLALIMLAFQVSGLNQSLNRDGGYMLQAYFPNIGGLKARARVTVAGVNVGRVRSIELDPEEYEAKVSIFINGKVELPADSAASILTAGLIGDNYVSIEPGADDELLQDGDVIEETHSAIVLEELIGKFLFNRDQS